MIIVFLLCTLVGCASHRAARVEGIVESPNLATPHPEARAALKVTLEWR